DIHEYTLGSFAPIVASSRDRLSIESYGERKTKREDFASFAVTDLLCTCCTYPGSSISRIQVTATTHHEPRLLTTALLVSQAIKCAHARECLESTYPADPASGSCPDR